MGMKKRPKKITFLIIFFIKKIFFSIKKNKIRNRTRVTSKRKRVEWILFQKKNLKKKHTHVDPKEVPIIRSESHKFLIKSLQGMNEMNQKKIFDGGVVEWNEQFSG